jgi:hypothetical protein
MKASALLLVGVLLVGAAVRLVGGVPLLQTDLLLTPATPGLDDAAGSASNGGQSDGTPEGAAASFYQFVQQGEYGKAWNVALEPDWPGAREASYLHAVAATDRPAGWTVQDQFVRRCSDDIGSGVRLNAIQVDRMESPPDSPEARAARRLGATRLFGVHASGQMLGACLIYRWDRNLVVAEIGGRYKVVLPGTKAARSLFHQEWFSNLSLVGSLRASGK